MKGDSIDDARHWLERSALQDQLWDQSPWPAQMARMMDSDTEREEDDDDSTPSARQRLSTRKRAETFPTSSSSSKVESRSSDTSLTLTLRKSPFQKSNSYRHYRYRSESSSLKEVIQRRRHTRRDSNPEPAVEHLHIDTILPLQLPPTNLKTISPLMAYPCPWWGDNSFENIRRSESSASFLSASSDGSWHGDHGDEDPNGQIEQALSQMSSSSLQDKQVTKDGLILQTYDYDEDLDEFNEPFPTRLGKEKDVNSSDMDDAEGDEIKAYAGPIMNNVASFFLDVKTLAWPSSFFSHQTQGSSSTSYNNEELSRMDRRLLMKSFSDCALFGTVSSPNQLNAEGNSINFHRRQRAATLSPSPMLPPHYDDDASYSKLQSLLQWFMPIIDDQLEHELFGYLRHSSLSRRDSIPSLATMSSTESNEDEEDSEDEMALTSAHFGLDQLIMSDQDVSLSTKRNLLPRQTYKKNPSLLDNTAPSPLWDNRWVEEPYQQTWSSILGLSSL